MKQIIRFIDAATGTLIARLEVEEGHDLSWESASKVADVLSRQIGKEVSVDINSV